VERGFIPKSDHSFKPAAQDPMTKLGDAKLVVLNKARRHQLAFKADKVLGTIIPEKNGLIALGDTPNESQHANNNPIKRLWRDARGDAYIELSLADLFKSNDFTNILNT
jgi:hypothetical protein